MASINKLSTIIANCLLIFLVIQCSNKALIDCQLTNLLNAVGPLLPRPIVPEATSNLVRQAGYIAIDHFVPTQEGYVINLVQIINPLIDQGLKRKSTILLIHGLFVNANFWLVMGTSASSRPQNLYDQCDAADLTQSQLEQLINNDRTSRSLPYLLSNCGYDVWLMNRRNSEWSRRASPLFNEQMGLFNKTGSFLNGLKSKITSTLGAISPIDLDAEENLRLKWPSSGSLLDRTVLSQMSLFNNNMTNYGNLYFNYSYDEQSLFDGPICVDFILEKTNRDKIDLIGHSAGGLIIAMMLSTNVNNMNSKVNHAALVAPAVDLHYTYLKTPIFQIFDANLLTLSRSVGQITFEMVLLLALIVNPPQCFKERAMGIPCNSIVDPIFGLGGDNFDMSVFIGSFMSYGCGGSFHEIAQLAQGGQSNQIKFFDKIDPERNAFAYGSLDIPKYNFSNINPASMSIWQGNTDRLVNQFNTFSFMQTLRNPFDYFLIGSKSRSVFFNHASFYLDRNVTALFNIPILKRISQANQ